MATAPKKWTRQVRTRNIGYSLPCSIDVKGSNPIRVDIPPNRWTLVPDEVYDMLKQKFGGEPRTHLVPDANANQDHPHGKDEPAIVREEVQETYIIEFK